MSTKVRSVLKNSGIAFGILGIATAFCFLVQRISESDTHVPLLFVWRCCLCPALRMDMFMESSHRSSLFSV